MFVGVAHTEHPEARELVPSDHCLLRFRERMPVRAPGGSTPAALLLELLAEADIHGWPPGWAVSERPAPLWAVAADLAFPLACTPTPGRWLAVTCLRRERR
jgi:hypothetical protein